MMVLNSARRSALRSEWTGQRELPRIARTPGDLLHIVWQNTAPGSESRVMYLTTDQAGITPARIRHWESPVWQEAFDLTSLDPNASPGTAPFIEAFRDSVFCVWNGGWPSRAGDVWRTSKSILSLPSDWWPPRNVSQTVNYNSATPVISRREPVVWSEECRSGRIRAILSDDPRRSGYNTYNVNFRFLDDLNNDTISNSFQRQRWPHVQVWETPAFYTAGVLWTESYGLYFVPRFARPTHRRPDRKVEEDIENPGLRDDTGELRSTESQELGP